MKHQDVIPMIFNIYNAVVPLIIQTVYNSLDNRWLCPSVTGIMPCTYADVQLVDNRQTYQQPAYFVTFPDHESQDVQEELLH